MAHCIFDKTDETFVSYHCLLSFILLEGRCCMRRDVERNVRDDPFRLFGFWTAKAVETDRRTDDAIINMVAKSPKAEWYHSTVWYKKQNTHFQSISVRRIENLTICFKGYEKETWLLL